MHIVSNFIQQHTFCLVIMSSFLPEKVHVREPLRFYFNFKKSTSKSYQMLVEAYGDNA